VRFALQHPYVYELKRNRLEIVHRQQELSHVLIESHRPEALPRAA